MPARINELSYDGGAGEFIEIRVEAGTDVSDLYLEVYGKTGPRSTLDATYAVSGGSFTSDGTYDYYVISVPMEDGPRAGIALVDGGTAIDSVFWGPTSPIPVRGGSLDGTSQGSIGTPLSNNSTDSLVPDENGNWVINTPTVGTQNFPCFVEGTCIATPSGEKPIEQLQAGDLVETLDHGAQPIRWIGCSEVSGLEEMAPIRIAAGVLDNRRAIEVSPQHRFLLTGWRCELLFGLEEVLASAKSLLHEGMVERVPRPRVRYYHILFDRHEILFAEGSATESFHPGDFIFDQLSEETRAEIVALFPELEAGGEGYGETARLTLKAFEGHILAA
ncbi:Hint domain-containing protein [Pseudoruegeria sp. SHC-113]|uniref:Hint domain-containing protein n=1 Tax=Pseudoruegeria sp. SHC-113 TaxID=2855439 RepID=UPI0021BAC4F3|nr:Hint domain-containing protein [Pseudoruegeria sp. SHC-113]MCT8159981.1 Hint domain-containing protein [Pseudoruegeria sp. SHC-113]